jgi:hypothetical protein
MATPAAASGAAIIAGKQDIPRVWAVDEVCWMRRVENQNVEFVHATRMRPISGQIAQQTVT